MKISRFWLEQFVDLNAVSNEEFHRLFNIRTAEIDGMESSAEQFAHMVIGEIKSIAAHPNANKLQVTQTDIGSQIVQIVCGAPNIREGMKVIVALPGSKVRWHGEGDLIELKEAELRGVKSFGMICGGNEVGIESTVDGVEDMSHLPVKPGIPLAQALGKNDTIIEIDNKSLTHRPDLWGHYGLARECAVIWHKKLKPLSTYKGKFGKDLLKINVKESKLCPRYMACRFSIEKIKDKEYIASFLNRIGHNSHGLLVDLTNYLLHELGQPLHVFDACKVNGSITVRKAHAGEKIVTLDGVERTLDEGMLVITDDLKILAIAGVMGGASSAIGTDTKEVILEAANFDPTCVRVTAQKLGLRTDAVQRYEKSLDPYLVEQAVGRFFYLLDKCADITFNSQLVDHFSVRPEPLEFTCNPERIAARIGAPITKKFITDILKSLGFTTIAKSKELQVTVPSFRATKDISSEVDIVEEIARFYGYEKIEPTLPQVQLTLPPPQAWIVLERKIKQFLAQSCHLNEVFNYSFYGPKELSRFQFVHEHVVLQNSLSEEHTHLRTTMLPAMLEVVLKNSTLYPKISVFELAKVYLSQGSTELPDERAHIAILYSAENETKPFYQVKQYLDNLLQYLQMPYRIISYQPQETENYMQKGRAAKVLLAGKSLGFIYEVSARMRSQYKLSRKVAYAELDFELLLEFAGKLQKQFKSLAKFPSKIFDVSVVVNKTVEAGLILTSMQKLHALIEQVELFDVFENETLGLDKKALAFKVVLQSQDKTLTDQNMHEVQKLIFGHLEKEYQGTIRGL